MLAASFQCLMGVKLSSFENSSYKSQLRQLMNWAHFPVLNTNSPLKKIEAAECAGFISVNRHLKTPGLGV